MRRRFLDEKMFTNGYVVATNLLLVNAVFDLGVVGGFLIVAAVILLIRCLVVGSVEEGAGGR